MSTKDGGPFHPCEVRLTDAGELLGAQTGNAQGIHTGASLRDYFAGLAMNGHVIALANAIISADSRQEAKQKWAELVAELAYETADAMIRAREAGQ